MIRFSYDAPPEENAPFQHFSLEGDNVRGYVLLGWDTPKPGATEDELPEMLQMWFETLGEAMNHCVNEFGIMKGSWHAPTVAPPVGKFDSSRKRRTQGEDSQVLNPDNVKKREGK